MSNSPESSPSNSVNTTPWDSLSTVKFAGDKPTSEKAPFTFSPDRQQRKIIASLLTHDYSPIAQPDVTLNSEYTTDFVNKLQTREISISDERNLLLKLGTPFHKNPESTFRTLNQNGHERWIFSQITGKNSIYDLTTSDIPDFLSQYPTPIDFSAKSNIFLSNLKNQVSDIEFGLYASAMESFKHHIYGKRYEYWQKMEELNVLAEPNSSPSTPESLSIKKPSELQKSPSAQKTSESSPNAKLTLIPPEIQESLLSHAQVEGDPYLKNGNTYRLSPDVLKYNHLAPKYELSLEGTQICLSDTFMVGNRPAAIAYIPTKDGVKVRSYYKSNSQGTWRYLPDYVTDQNGEGASWYGKGHSEESLTLPIELQSALSRIQANGPIHPEADPTFLLVGTTYRYSSQKEYSTRLHSDMLRGSFYQEVDSSPVKSFNVLNNNSKLPPERLMISDPLAPNFTQPLSSFNSSSSLAGQIHIESFQSNDSELLWNFYSDTKNHAWIGNIETKSPITSTGLRANWISAGDYATPLYEYSAQTAGYGDATDTRGRYQSMWKNYLSKAPLIRQYLARKSHNVL